VKHSDRLLTGERLDAGNDLYAADLVRHRVAYRFAASHAGDGSVLDLGCGTGYGSAELAVHGARVIGMDRIAASAFVRDSDATFVRGDLSGLPFAAASFDLIVTFQVIEHLSDSAPYLEGLSTLLRPHGVLLLSTPNVLQSDGENPFHVHEYQAEELYGVLSTYFGEVEMLGVGAAGDAWRYHEERLRRIRLITRLDPLRLRRALPRAVVEWAFARLSLLVRSGLGRSGVTLRVAEEDFRVGPADDRTLDLLAVCRSPRSGGPS